jgi:hypothetical protein
MEKLISKPNSGRRSFLWKAGAAMTATAAAVVPGIAKSRDSKNSDADRLAHRLGVLEDEKAIRALNQAYETLLESGSCEDVVSLFTEDAVVVFNGGVFQDKKGVARLYRNRFSAGMTGKKIGSVPGFEAESVQHESIVVAEDRKSAQAKFPYSIQVGTPMASDSSLVQMARLQGEGILKWCENGNLQVSYAKDAKSGSWKIKGLEYRVSSQTDYRPGKSSARSISAPVYAKTFPEDSAGPDRLIVPEQMPQRA